jgi:hypothetical protein
MIRKFSPAVVRGCATLLVAAGLLGVGAAAASAAGSPRKAAQLANSAFTHAAHAGSVTVAGSGTYNGQSVAIHLVVKANGDGAGTITLGGHVLHVVKVGPVGYMKADAGFWRSEGGTDGPAVASLVAGRWLKASGAKSPLASFNQFLGVRNLVNDFGPAGVHWASATRTTYHGHAAWALKGTQGGQPGTVIVATGSPGYPLAVDAPGHEAVTFTNWNHPATITAPSGALDLSSLGG